MKEFNTNNSDNTNRISITSKVYSIKQENEKKLMEKYPLLEDPKQSRYYFGSYDFHPNEQYIIDFWKDLIEFLYETTFNCFAAKLGDIYDLTKIKGKRPLGLANIIKKMNNDNYFVFQKDLLSDEYFKKYHTEVMPADSVIGSVKKKLYSFFSTYIYNTNYVVEPQLDDILINIKLFKVKWNL